MHPEYSSEDLKSAEIVIFPIFQSLHWLVGAIDLNEHKIIVIDSMRLHGETFLQLFKKTETEINAIFVKDGENPNWNYIDRSSEVPYQTDHHSCGPLSVLNAEYFVKKIKFEYDIKHIISNLRYNICLSVYLHHEICKDE